MPLDYKDNIPDKIDSILEDTCHIVPDKRWGFLQPETCRKLRYDIARAFMEKAYTIGKIKDWKTHKYN